jgi:hypothetical protein
MVGDPVAGMGHEMGHRPPCRSHNWQSSFYHGGWAEGWNGEVLEGGILKWKSYRPTC